MQASTVLPMSPNLNFHGFSKDFAEISPEMIAEFNEKLKFGGSESEFAEESKDFEEKEVREEEEEDEEEEEEEEEFSFFCMNTDESPISAEDLFKDGQIRPVFPIFDQSLLFADDGDFSRPTSVSSSASSSSSLRPPLKKLFVEDRRDAPSSASDDEFFGAAPGTYCEWHGQSAVETSPEMSKKCNSTGFSRLWRFRDLVVRSSSDGKDAFVFLNPNGAKSAAEKVVEKESKVSSVSVAAAEDSPAVKVTAAKKKKKKSESVSSAHERHYVRNRAMKEVDKRRSYLPYRPGLVGFFANVNGLSRNVHPF